MANFTIYKGDQRVLPFFVEDLNNLTDYSAIWTLSDEEFGNPITGLTKFSTGPDPDILIDEVTRQVDVYINVNDLDYNSGIVVGDYYYQLILINNGTSPSVPRVFVTGVITLNDSVYYKSL